MENYKTVEAPVVTIDDFHHKEKTFILHNYINEKGKLIINKDEAHSLMLELYKFIKNVE